MSTHLRGLTFRLNIRWAGRPAGSAVVGGPGGEFGRPRLALAVLSLVLFLAFLGNTVVSVTLASVQSELHAGVTALQWVVGGYALTFAGLMLVFGTLGHLFGRRRIMGLGIAIFCAGSVLGALA